MSWSTREITVLFWSLPIDNVVLHFDLHGEKFIVCCLSTPPILKKHLLGSGRITEMTKLSSRTAEIRVSAELSHACLQAMPRDRVDTSTTRSLPFTTMSCTKSAPGAPRAGPSTSQRYLDSSQVYLHTNLVYACIKENLQALALGSNTATVVHVSVCFRK